MRFKWPILQDKLALQTGFVALVVYTTILCFQTTFPPITFAISLYWLFYVLSFRKLRFKRIVKNPLVWFWSAYYIIVCVGLLYTANSTEGWKDVLLKITLFLWPLAFSSWPEAVWSYKDRVLQAFAWVLSISALCVIVIGTWRWDQSGTKLNQLFGYLNIWPMIPNHYMALYAGLGIFSFVHVYRKKLQGLWPTILGMAILVSLIFVTSVRIQLIAIPLAGLVFILYELGPTKNRRRVIGFTLAGIVGVAILAAIIPSSRSRINDTIDEIKSINGVVNDRQTNHRVFIWRYGLEVVQEHALFGTGTGSSDLALHEKLKHCDAKFWHGHKAYFLYEKMYNYHNAFLQHLATHGLLMFVVFCVILVGPFFMLKGKIGGVEAAFLTLCILAFSTESMLERQAGVLFFGFFYNFFFTSAFIRPDKSITGK